MTRKSHWTDTPTFIISLLALLFAAIAAWPVIRDWFPKPPVVPSASVVQSLSVPATPLRHPVASPSGSSFPQPSPVVSAATPTPQAIPADDKPSGASDLYLAAYLAFQKAEKMTSNNSIADAIRTYKESDEILITISKTFPTWNKPIVEYRKARIADALQMLESGNRPQRGEEYP